MKKSDLADLSVIQQKRYPNQSQQTLEESKKQIHICCPFNKSQNYYCSICNRLRKVCPFGYQSTYQHQVSSLFQNQQISMYNRRENQGVNLGQRNRIFSMNESIKNPQIINRQIKHEPSPSVLQKQIHTQITVPQTEQIIFYPVIHNIVKNQFKQKSTESTPVRKSRRQVAGHVNDDKILTPTQFKQLVDSFRMQ